MFLLEEKRGLRYNFVTHSDFKITTGYAVVLGHERVNYHALYIKHRVLELRQANTVGFVFLKLYYFTNIFNLWF